MIIYYMSNYIGRWHIYIGLEFWGKHIESITIA